MTRDDADRELERRFAEARRADEAAAPDLDRLLARPRGARRASAAARRVGLAVAALALAAAAAILFRSRPAGTPLPPAAAQLAAWKSPTASLLRTPGAELWGRVPALAPRVPVFASVSLPQTTKGADR